MPETEQTETPCPHCGRHPLDEERVREIAREEVQASQRARIEAARRLYEEQK